MQYLGNLSIFVPAFSVGRDFTLAMAEPQRCQLFSYKKRAPFGALQGIVTLSGLDQRVNRILNVFAEYLQPVRNFRAIRDTMIR